MPGCSARTEETISSEITEMRDLMDNVFASIASGVITIDEDERIALYNRAAERILGFPDTAVMRETYKTAMDHPGAARRTAHSRCMVQRRSTQHRSGCRR